MVAASVEAPLKGMKVLVVEDEAIVSFLLEDTLQKLGCTDIVLAGRLHIAHECLDQGLPDLAVLDVNLGGELVYSVAERLRTAGVPFVFAAGYGVSGIAPEWKSAAIIQKPFATEQLTAVIDALIAK